MTDLSIILPYYKRLEAFRQALAFNHRKFVSTSERSTEVVLVLDEPSEEAGVLGLVERYGRISWRVLINRREHAWRNPSVAINVGIRHAKGEFVLVLSPESICATDVPTMLLEGYGEPQPSFRLGRVHQCERSVIAAKGIERAYGEGEPKRYYGSICSPRAALESIRGYHESNRTWGCDDDNVRARLTLQGLRTEYVRRAGVIHPLEPHEVSRKVRRREKDARERHAYVFPCSAVANGEDWGREFDEIIYERQGRAASEA
jgi:glycosyltransferase involved in cell wall biosynthesis